MKCLSGAELEQYISGKLAPEGMIEAVTHVCACEKCRTALASLPSYRMAWRSLENQILAQACPEYEELSAFLDGSLPEVRRRAVSEHLSACELCLGDLERMRELRERAELAPRITMTPGRTSRRSAWRGWIPRLVPAGVAAAAAVLALLLLPERSEKLPTPPRPSIARNMAPSPEPPASPRTATPQVGRTERRPVPGPEVRPARRPSKPVPPRPEVIARTSDYSRLGGSESQIERIKRAVEEKLRTGRLTADAPIRMAMARAAEAVRAPSSLVGPEPISPSRQTVLRENLTLKWRPVEGAEEYQVEVTRLDGTPIFTGQTTESHLTIPASQLPAEGGGLYWRASVRLGTKDLWESGRATVIYVLGESDTNLIRRARQTYPGDHLLLGTIYEMHGLYADAEREFQKLIAAPTRPSSARRMLAEVRGKMR